MKHWKQIRISTLNQASSLVGYDLSKGNPFAVGTIEDPGLRKQVESQILKI